MLKVLIVCANGTGTSLMMKEKAQMSLIKLEDYDLIFCHMTFVDNFKYAEKKGIKVIGINNILSEEEFKQKLESSGYLEELKNK